MDKFERFRAEYPVFEYKSFSLDEDENEIRVQYSFETRGLTEFSPKWTFRKPSAERFCGNTVFRRMIFSLGMVELISYWKATCSPKVIISAGGGTPEQALWWKKLYFGGLGEFFYVNGITTDRDGFMELEFTGESLDGEAGRVKNDKKLISIGGGKDSVVSVELLKDYGAKRYCYMINPNASTLGTVQAGGIDEENIVASKRVLDMKIVELNKEGFLNGHTPFSAIIAFSSLIGAYINSIGQIVLSNESSANESTVAGSDVNHQYSKSYEFEKDFTFYEKKYIGSGIEYFSLLRPLTEFQIAWYFAKKNKYHGIFRSCNLGSKTGVWCCNCPKCLFVYTILSPFLSEKELVSVFGENLLEKTELIPTLDKLAGVVPEKPFECVGSRDEVKLAAWLTAKKYEDAGREYPALIKHFKEIFDGDFPDEYRRIMSYCDEENAVPSELYELVKREFNLNGRSCL